MSPGWDDWKPEAQFLADLNQWNRQNKDNKLSDVLGKINSAIEDSKPFIDFIPNSPFPAGTLVKALASLIQLGAV